MQNTNIIMTFFRIKRNGETMYFKTLDDLKKSVWVNKETGNVYTIKPPKDRIKGFLEYMITVYKRPTEKAVNNAKIVL